MNALLVGKWIVKALGGYRATAFLLLAVAFLASSAWYKHEALRVKGEWAKANSAAIVASARAAQLAAEIAQARQEAATRAAEAARDRNDDVLPKTRRESAGRVERAPTAGLPVRVSDVEAARGAYEAAAGVVRGTQSR